MDNKTIGQILDKISEILEKRKLIISMINKENYLVFGNNVVLQTFQACQYMVDFFAVMEGFKIDARGMVLDSEAQHGKPFPFRRLITQLDKYIPQKYSKLLMSLQIIRNKAAHMQSLTADDYLDYFDTFNSFGLWFVTNNIVIQQLTEDQEKQYSRLRIFLGQQIVADKEVQNSLLYYYKSLSRISCDTKNISELISNEEIVAIVISEGDRIADTKLDKVLEKLDRIEASQKSISSQLNDISKQISELGQRVSDYQLLVERQLSIIESGTAQERILSAYTDVLIEKIKDGIMTQYDQREYQTEQEVLKQTFGNTWEKLQSSTKKFLISAKILHRHQIVLGNQTDYSGVCVLITKALEVEVAKRFYGDFMEYLKTHCIRADGPRNEKYLDFPSHMLNKWKKPIRSKDFTLGSVAYALCYSIDEQLSEAEQEKNKLRLLEFCRSELLSNRSDDEIMRILTEYAEEIETVRKDYRNPSAHTNMLQEINAKECMDLVIDVEKLLKRMIDSFDK